MKYNDIEWGPVKVIAGRHKGRIACLDECEDGRTGICYFGDLHFHASSADVPLRSLAKVTTNDLLSRKDELSFLIGPFAKKHLPASRQLDLLHEYHFICNALAHRWEVARYERGASHQKRVFISHSSKDQEFARWLSVDLANLGHSPWLDEWEIKAGQSIPKRLSEGLQQSDVLVVLLSPTAVESGWVEREWHAKYWDEVSSGKVMVIPALLAECSIPILLKTKKYADFTNDRRLGFEELLTALGSH